jgi:hypothetical protein
MRSVQQTGPLLLRQNLPKKTKKKHRNCFQDILSFWMLTWVKDSSIAHKQWRKRGVVFANATLSKAVYTAHPRERWAVCGPIGSMQRVFRCLFGVGENVRDATWARGGGAVYCIRACSFSKKPTESKLLASKRPKGAHYSTKEDDILWAFAQKYAKDKDLETQEPVVGLCRTEKDRSREKRILDGQKIRWAQTRTSFGCRATQRGTLSAI